MSNFEQVLERHGVKYFLALSVFFYVVGTIIFNIYLRSLGSFEFDLLQLRYMFVGLTFCLITGVFPLVALAVAKGVGVLCKKKVAPPKRMSAAEKGRLTRARNARRKKIWLWSQLIFGGFLVLWTPIYAQHIFPMIPSGFGGAKPTIARLTGSVESIQRINDLIAFESGVDASKLPFEIVPGASNLAIGANVLILDKNDDRIFLLLTEELYLRSTSSFARKMIETGEVPTSSLLSDEETVALNFKPLIVSADGVQGITLSLYEPPQITTSNDLKLAATLLAEQPETAGSVSAAISADLPGVGEKLVAAVQEQSKPKPTPKPVENQTPDPVVEPDPVVTPAPEESQTIEQVIAAAIEDSVDTKFLDFRARIFSQSGLLWNREMRGEIDRDGRRFLIQQITDAYKTDFADAWALLDPTTNFLVTGQNDADFARKIQQAFRGAESAKQVIERLNATERDTVPKNFVEVRDGGLAILQQASRANTPENRAFVSGQLVNYLNSEAAEQRPYWENVYLESGVEDEDYLENIEVALTQPTSWEDFRNVLVEFSTPAPTCTDTIQNGDETSVDCGGSCDACVVEPPAPTCTDTIQNGDETGVDCGGSCDACVVEPPAPTCTDTIQNGDETGVDCGGSCDACVPVEPTPAQG